MGKKLIFCLLLSLFTNSLLGQHSHLLKPPKHPPTEVEVKLDEINKQCIHRNKYTIEQRLKFYPFNKAKQVKLVSFKNYSDPPIAHSIGDTSNQIQEIKSPFENKRVDYSTFTELKILNKTQVNKLTDVLFNWGYRRTPDMISSLGANCFYPRNAILFVDARGRTFAYIEICFECEQYELSSYKIKMGQLCDNKIKILKDYFTSVGIEYGVTKENRRTYN